MKKIISILVASSMMVSAGTLIVNAEPGDVLLENPDMEGIDSDNNKPWWWGATDGCEYSSDTSKSHSGSASSYVYDRKSYSDGIFQWVFNEDNTAGKLEEGK